MSELPYVDPRSPHGFIRATAEYLRDRLERLGPSQILKANHIQTSVTGAIYWFRDLPEVRRELEMEEMP